MFILIWGWRYYFLRNPYYIHAHCEKCRQFRPLLCYDAIRFFTLYHVPLIPLRRYSITHECSHCRRHQRMPYSRYRKMIWKDVEPLIQTACDRPSDSDTVRAAVILCLHYCHMDGFRRLAEAAVRGTRSDAALAVLIAMGYRMLGEPEPAERALLAALPSDGDGKVRLALIHHYLLMGPHQRAASHILRRIEIEGEAALNEVPGFLNAMQLQDRHHDVVTLVDDIAERFPDVNLDVLRRIRYDSSQECGSMKRDAGGRPTFQAPRPPSRRIVQPLLMPSLLLFAFIVFAVSCLLARPGGAYVVNGLDTPYDVSVNGTTLSLPARAETRVAAEFGDNVIEAGPGAPPFEPIHFRIESDFFSRLFDDRVWIVNPDQLAAIVWKDIRYAPNPSSTPVDNRRFFAGKDRYVFDNVDYPFASPPDSLTVESGTGVRLKTQIYVERDMTHAQISAYLAGSRLPQDAVPYAKRLLTRAPNYEAIAVAAVIIPPEEFAPILKQLTEARPLNIQVHRFRQSWIEEKRPGADLRAEYLAMLDADPDNRDLAYLASRVADSTQERRSLLERSIQEPNPSAFGFFGLAYLDACLGDFDKALAHAREAATRAGDNVQFRAMFEDMLLANGQAKELETLLSDRAFGPRFDLSAAVMLVRVAAIRDRDEAHRRETELELAACAHWGIASNHPTLVENRRWCELAICEGARDRACVVAKLSNSDDPTQQVWLALLERDVGRLEKLRKDNAEELDIPAVMIDRLTYAIARQLGKDDIGQRALERVMTFRSARDASSQKIASWLNGDVAPPAEDVAASSSPGSDAAITLCVFAERFPERAAEYKALARKQNYSRFFPQFVLDDLLNSGE
ncbi:MAG: hypothetical protein KDA33_04890 [Phycisphaerales bacterium]|nr:hypothetical protein [Phycisphaerales bacterium]